LMRREHKIFQKRPPKKTIKSKKIKSWEPKTNNLSRYSPVPQFGSFVRFGSAVAETVLRIIARCRGDSKPECRGNSRPPGSPGWSQPGLGLGRRLKSDSEGLEPARRSSSQRSNRRYINLFPARPVTAPPGSRAGDHHDLVAARPGPRRILATQCVVRVALSVAPSHCRPYRVARWAAVGNLGTDCLSPDSELKS
jgi:hypothetical protein